ncbi:MAG: DUF2634 domain-containing protein [Peptoniphilus sp.]|nr:DUF2634 domain-containing protein [Peptoniphilus sp.]MDY3119149.1 DUF2634 domain-containing protein [Peptoniphilus sp.]
MLRPEESFDEFALFDVEAMDAAGASKTYAMAIDDERVIGHVDGVDALKQMIYKNINTEPVYPIYANFGVKKADLFGMPKSYAYVEMIRRIEEALLLDDRVLAVRDFYYDEARSKGGDLVFSFVVDSIYGAIEEEEVVHFG